MLDRLRQAVHRRAALGWDGAARAETILDAMASVAVRQEQPGVPDEERAEEIANDRLIALTQRFGLDDVEADLFRLVHFAESSTAAHLLMGLLSGDEGPHRPTVALVLELAGVEAIGDNARHYFAESRPLRRFGLVDVQNTEVLLARRLATPDRLADHLAGVDAFPQHLLPMLVQASPLTEADTTLVAAALTAGHPLTWIFSPFGTSGLGLAAAACAGMNLSWWAADFDRLPPEIAPASAFRELLLECALTGSILVVMAAELIRPDLLLGAGVPVLAVSRRPWNPGWSAQIPPTVLAPRVTVLDRRRGWEQIGVDPASAPELAAMRLTPEQIRMAGQHAALMAGLDGRTTVGLEAVRQSARQVGRASSSRHPVDPRVSAGLADLVLPPHMMDEITRLLDWARTRDDVAALGPRFNKGGKGTGICALFSGPPGTGKTLAAHVVADTLGMDLHQIDLSSIVDKYIGETEKNLERAFAEAEAANAVLFFDEADALFGSRSEIKDAKDRYANQEVAYLLQRMEQFDGITILASNLRGNIDAAFARRLHFIVVFPEPDVPTRKRLWQHHLDSVPLDPADEVDTDLLARVVDLAGGDIRNVVLSATFAAMAQGVGLGMKHIEAAVAREYNKLGRRQPRWPTQ